MFRTLSAKSIAAIAILNLAGLAFPAYTIQGFLVLNRNGQKMELLLLGGKFDLRYMLGNSIHNVSGEYVPEARIRSGCADIGCANPFYHTLAEIQSKKTKYMYLADTGVVTWYDGFSPFSLIDIQAASGPDWVQCQDVDSLEMAGSFDYWPVTGRVCAPDSISAGRFTLRDLNPVVSIHKGWGAQASLSAGTRDPVDAMGRAANASRHARFFLGRETWVRDASQGLPPARGER